MSEIPRGEQPEQEEPSPDLKIDIPKERLVFDEREGWYEYGRIPYKIYYQLGSETSVLAGGDKLDEKTPVRYLLTQDLGSRGVSLSVFIHDSVPQKFEDIAMFHELREAELQFADGISRPQAHKVSEKETNLYARKYLSDEEFKEFAEWQKKLSSKKIKRRKSDN